MRQPIQCLTEPSFAARTQPNHHDCGGQAGPISHELRSTAFKPPTRLSKWWSGSRLPVLGPQSRLRESQYVVKPQGWSLAVNRVTTLDDDDVSGWEPIHQDRPIRVCQR
jgi:hypothetical protein